MSYIVAVKINHIKNKLFIFKKKHQALKFKTKVESLGFETLIAIEKVRK